MQVSESVLRQGAQLFGVDAGGLRSLGGMDGAVYAGERDGAGFVLKFVPTAEDRLLAVQEKWHFVNYLVEGGVRVARPIASRAGRLVEEVRDGEQAYAVFQAEQAPGRHLDGSDPALINDALYREWGRVMGRMHALTRRYVGGAHIESWREELQFMAGWCPDSEVRAKWGEMERQLDGLPQPANAYGLIHNDLHPFNFLVHEGRITVIDFDVCNHHWFANDLGIALFHGIWVGAPRGAEWLPFVRNFSQRLMEGYAEENTLGGEWHRRMPLFLKYRQMLLFSVFTNEWREPRNAWKERTLREWRQSIVEDRAVIEEDLFAGG